MVKLLSGEAALESNGAGQKIMIRFEERDRPDPEVDALALLQSINTLPENFGR
jgi:hypothetical protein